MPAGGVPDPNLAALTCALVLVLVVGFSALNAALVSGVLYLALSAVRREGGARGAARAVAQRVAELSLRVGLTPAQFGFLLIAAAVLVWNLWLRGGSSSSYGGSSSYGRGAAGTRRRRRAATAAAATATTGTAAATAVWARSGTWDSC